MPEPHKITKLYAFVLENDGGVEGLMAFYQPDTGGWMPMVGSDLKRVNQLHSIAKTISKTLGKPFKVLEFEKPTDITASLDGVDN